MLGLSTYLGLLTVLGVGTLIRPPVGLTAVLCVFALKQWGQSTTTIFAQNSVFTNYAVGFLVVVGVLRLAMSRSCLFCRFPPSAVFIALLYGYAFVTVTWAPDSQTSLDQWASAAPYIVTIAVLTPVLISDLADARTAFQWIVFVGGSICFLELIFGTWGFRGLSAGDTELNPLALAGVGGTVLLASSMFILGKRNVLLRIVAMACIPLAVALILRSGSRGQLLALVPAFAVAALIAFRLSSARSLIALVLTAALVTGLGWWASTLVALNTSRWTGADLAAADVYGRLDMATALLRAALAHPATLLFGLGNSSSFQVLGIYPHITIVEVLAEEGIPGITLYLAILVISIRSILRIYRSLGDNETDRRTLAILAALLCFELILSWKQGTLLSSFYVFAYAIILGRIELRAAERSPVAINVRPEVNLPPFPNLLR